MPATAYVMSVGIGTCCCHHHPECRDNMPGMIVSGSPNKFTNNLPNARLTDVFLGACGHVSIMASGSPNDFTDELPQCRVMDTFVGCITGIIVSGSPNSVTN